MVIYDIVILFYRTSQFVRNELGVTVELVRLDKLSVGSFFIRHDDWGDGQTLHLKLKDVETSGPQEGSVFVTRLDGTYDHLMGFVSVQPVSLTEKLGTLLQTLCGVRT